MSFVKDGLKVLAATAHSLWFNKTIIAIILTTFSRRKIKYGNSSYYHTDLHGKSQCMLLPFLSKIKMAKNCG